MRLVVDTSVLVGELLRARGRERLADDRLLLYLPERMWAEARVELPRRITSFVRRKDLDSHVGDDLATRCLDAVEANVLNLDEAVYATLEDEARARSVRDPDDWPVVKNTGAWRLLEANWSTLDENKSRMFTKASEVPPPRRPKPALQPERGPTDHPRTRRQHLLEVGGTAGHLQRQPVGVAARVEDAELAHEQAPLRA